MPASFGRRALGKGRGKSAVPCLVFRAEDGTQRIVRGIRTPAARAGLQGKSSRLRPDRIFIMESLILAQNERWRRVLSMQVGRQSSTCLFLLEVYMYYVYIIALDDEGINKCWTRAADW